MDNQMVGDLFSNTIEAATLMDHDRAFVKELQRVIKQLPPKQKGRWGQEQTSKKVCFFFFFFFFQINHIRR